MGRASLDPEARVARGGRTVACEVEAAEALEALSRRRSAYGGGATGSGELKLQRETDSQDKLMAAGDQANNHTSSRDHTSLENIHKIVQNIGEGHLWNSTRSRTKLTAAERKEKQLRRKLSNREAARKTIKRRQANHMELKRKAANMSENNENLKKEKELAMKHYISLKRLNDFLKAELAKTKEAERGDRRDVIISWLDQPSLGPCFWTPILQPPVDIFNPRPTLLSHDAGPEPARLPILYPVPWLVPFFVQGVENVDKWSKCLCSESLLHETTNTCLLTNQNTSKIRASNSKKTMLARGPGPYPTEISGNDEKTVHNPDGSIYVPGLFSSVRAREESTVDIEMHM